MGTAAFKSACMVYRCWGTDTPYLSRCLLENPLCLLKKWCVHWPTLELQEVLWRWSLSRCCKEFDSNPKRCIKLLCLWHSRDKMVKMAIFMVHNLCWDSVNGCDKGTGTSQLLLKEHSSGLMAQQIIICFYLGPSQVQWEPFASHATLLLWPDSEKNVLMIYNLTYRLTQAILHLTIVKG